eukprot:g3237.t1
MSSTTLERAALAGTNTREIEIMLEKYLATKRIDSLFTNMSESLLLSRPDNPVRYLREYLAEHYPGACKKDSSSSSSSSSSLPSSNALDLTGGPQTDSSGDEADLSSSSSDEEEEEVVAEKKDASDKDATEDTPGSLSSSTSSQYVRILKGMPKLNPSARRAAVSASSDQSSFSTSDPSSSASSASAAEPARDLREDLLSVLREKNASRMFLKFVTSHAKKSLNDLRFLLAVERFKARSSSTTDHPRAAEERTTELLNEYIIRGAERMIALTDPERREIANIVRGKPTTRTFDGPFEIVLARTLKKVHRPGKGKALSLFGQFLQRVREVEGIEEDEGGGEDAEDLEIAGKEEEEDLEIDRRGLSSYLGREHPLFSHLPKSVLSTLVSSAFSLVTFRKRQTVASVADRTDDDTMYVVARGRCQKFVPLTPAEAVAEAERAKRETRDGALLKKLLKKRKKKAPSDDPLSMKDSPALKQILGHVDLSKFKWYGWIGPRETIRDVALLHDAPSTAWIRASPEERPKLWAIRRGDFKRLVAKGMEAYRDGVVRALRDSSSVLAAAMTDLELARVACAAREFVYEESDRVLARGASSRRLFVVAEGVARMTQGERERRRTVCELAAGTSFGELSLLVRGRVSQVDVSAASPSLRCLCVSRRSIERVVGPLLALLRERSPRIYREVMCGLRWVSSSSRRPIAVLTTGRLRNRRARRVVDAEMRALAGSTSGGSGGVTVVRVKNVFGAVCAAAEGGEDADSSSWCTRLLTTTTYSSSSQPNVWDLATSAVFCIEPGGDTPTRSHVYVAILSGCIPVLFDADEAHNGYPGGKAVRWPWRRDAEQEEVKVNEAAADDTASFSSDDLTPSLDYRRFAIVLNATRVYKRRTAVIRALIDFPRDRPKRFREMREALDEAAEWMYYAKDDAAERDAFAGIRNRLRRWMDGGGR